MWAWYELSTSLHSSEIPYKYNGVVRNVLFLSHRSIEHASEPFVTVATSLSMWTQYYWTRGYPWTTPTSTSSSVTSFQRYRTPLFFGAYLYSEHVLHGPKWRCYKVHKFKSLSNYKFFNTMILFVYHFPNVKWKILLFNFFNIR